MTAPINSAVRKALNDATNNGNLDRFLTVSMPIKPMFSVEIRFQYASGPADLIGPLSLQEALRLVDKLGECASLAYIEAV